MVDPLAEDMKAINQELGGQLMDESGELKQSLVFGADKWGQDVVLKTIKGAETSIIVGLISALLAVVMVSKASRSAAPPTGRHGSSISPGATPAIPRLRFMTMQGWTMALPPKWAIAGTKPVRSLPIRGRLLFLRNIWVRPKE